MGDKITSAGWLVELMRCDHFDDPPPTGWYAANLIAPQGGSSNDPTHLHWANGPVAVCSGREASDSLQVLLRPWEWTISQWQVYASTDGGATWAKLTVAQDQSGVDPVDPGVSQDIQRALLEELEQNTADCADAFSIADPRWIGHPDGNVPGAEIVEQSWPHAVVSLTHAPAGLSNDVLKFGHFLQFDTPATLVVAFPVFSLNGMTFSPPEVPVRNTRGDLVAAIYDRPFNGMTLVFAMPPTSTSHNNLMAQTAAPVQEGLKAREVIDELVAAHLLPGVLLGEAVAGLDFKSIINNADDTLIFQKTFPQAEWHWAIIRCLGSGWFRLRGHAVRTGPDAWTRPHVLQFSSNQDRLDQLVDAYCPSPSTQTISDALEQAFPDPALQDATVMLGALGQQLPSGTLSQAVSNLLEVVEPLDPNAKDADKKKRLAAVQKFFIAWDTVASALTGSDRGVVMAAWIKARISLQRAQASGTAQRALDAIAGSLPAGFDSPTSAQLALGVLDTRTAPSGLWPLINQFVEVRGNKTQEDPIFASILLTLTAGVQGLAPGALLPSTFQNLPAWGGYFRDSFDSRTASSTHQPQDEGLRLEFDAMAFGATSIDHLIRGFALALCGSIESSLASEAPFIDVNRARWITNTAVRYHPLSGRSQLVHGADSAAPAWYASGIGSATVGAKRVGQATYTGRPLCAILEDPSGTPIDAPTLEAEESFEQRWPVSATEGSAWNSLPLLAFGANYRAQVTAIDNAGGIVQKVLRSSTNFTSLAAVDWSQQAPFMRYESRVPAGSPEVRVLVTALGQTNPSPVDATELSAESRALRFVSQQLETRQTSNTVTELVVRAALPQVFTLVPRTGQDPAHPKLLPWYLPDRPAQLQLQIRPPRSAVEFIRSWLAADQMVLDSSFSPQEKARAASDKAFVDHPQAFDAFRQSVCTVAAITPSNTGGGQAYNSIVSALGIELYDGAVINQLDPIEIARTKWDGSTLQPTMPTVGLTIVADASINAATVTVVNQQRVLTLPAGHFVRVRIYSLVEDSFFVPAQGSPARSSRMRFASFLGESQTGKWQAYRRFGPVEYWVESLPNWNAPPDANYFELQMTLPDASHPELVQLTMSSRMSADWIRAVEINRHSWHWTGYPVQFPPLSAATDLPRWLPAFAGVESQRDKRQVVLTTYVDPATQWSYADQQWSPIPVLNRATLDIQRLEAGNRPSRYMAYTARPLVRFRAWLQNTPQQGPRSLEQDIFATGDVILGVTQYVETQRLSTPAFQYRIPLTATYQYDSNQPGALKLARINNGNLLIFNDAIRRTDSFSRVGGIGDSIEIDLMQTRTFTIQGAQTRPFWEIGPNPIFHKSPATGLPPGQVQTLDQLTVLTSAPHGLTYDIVPNAKVAQTAVLVRAASRVQGTVGSANSDDPRLGQWMLAKLRARRLLLPELILDASITPDGTGNYPLPWRRTGLDRIPADFAVDFTPGSGTRRVDILCDGTPYSLSMPDMPPGPRARLLVSFHKDRWDPNQPPGPPTGVPYWAPQVISQQPRADLRGNESLGWDTFATSTCHGKPAWLPTDGALAVRVSGAPVTNVYVAQLSDYSDPRWVLFIGRIPGTRAQGADQYTLSVRADAQGKVQKLVLTKGSFAPLARPPQSATDWSSDQVEFYVLLVSASPTNIIAGSAGTEDVGLLAFQSNFDPVQNTLIANEFVPLGIANPPDASRLMGATALLCAFQRISSPSNDERRFKINSLDCLVKAIFPDPIPGSDQVLESLARPTGNHWGPMVISTDPDS